jgi:hypothetical protein
MTNMNRACRQLKARWRKSLKYKKINQRVRSKPIKSVMKFLFMLLSILPLLNQLSKVALEIRDLLLQREDLLVGKNKVVFLEVNYRKIVKFINLNGKNRILL